MPSNKLDAFLDRLQDDINNEAYEAYGPKGYERWRNPKYCHAMEDCDSRASLTGDCGDTMEIFIKMAEERVVDGSYRTTGCASSSICGSFAVELALGKTAGEILDMSGQTILDELGRFPKKEEHCAHLAITTLQEALNIYMRKTVSSGP